MSAVRDVRSAPRRHVRARSHGARRVLAMVAGSLVLVGLIAPMVGAQVPALPPFNQSALYTTEAQFQRAIAPYQAAIAANPRNVQAHYWLGVGYLIAYRQSISGVALYARGFLPRAIAPLREAVRLDPGHVGASLMLQEALLLAQEPAPADAVTTAILRRIHPGYVVPPE